MILGLLKKLLIFAYFSTFFIAFFRNISILTYIYIQFLFHLDFQELKKNLENLFLALTSLISEKTKFSHFSLNFSVKLT